MRTTTARSLPLLALVAAGAFALGTGAVAQNTPTAPTPAPTTAPRTLSVATLAPAGSTWMRGLEAAGRELRRRTGGALSLRFYPGGVQGDESEVIRKIRQGRLDIGVVTGIGLGQVHRPVLAFMLPGMFSSREALDRSRTALGPEVEQQFAGQGFVLLAWGSGAGPRMFSRRAVRSPADLQQTHPWIWRDDVILPALYTEAHAEGVPLALPEVLAALQTNRVDTVIAPPYAAVALQWSAQLTHMSEGANSYSVGGMVVSKRTWDSLPAPLQATTREVINQFLGLINRNVSRDDESAAQTMTTRGMTAVTYTDAERTQWADLFRRTRARLVGTVSDAAWMERVRTASPSAPAPAPAAAR
jgi:TRAP-type C4-dicarboxylate transport system substrate-binding protein